MSWSSGGFVYMLNMGPNTCIWSSYAMLNAGDCLCHGSTLMPPLDPQPQHSSSPAAAQLCMYAGHTHVA